MQQNKNAAKNLPEQNPAGNKNESNSQQAATVLTAKETKQHKAAVAEEVHETFKDENMPSELSLGDDGLEVGGEGG